MKFEEVLPALKAGKKIRRDGIAYFEPDGENVRSIEDDFPDDIKLRYLLDFEDILADDWEIVE